MKSIKQNCFVCIPCSFGKQNCFVCIPCSFGRTITCYWREWKYTSKGILCNLNPESGLVPFSEINRVRLIPVLKEYC